MKVKVSEATGVVLDILVAIAKGIPAEELYPWGRKPYRSLFRRTRDEDGKLDGKYTTGPDLIFSRKWEAGGPIIEREGISLIQQTQDRWVSEYSNGCDRTDHARSWGSTPLIAAMRCYVASKLGDEVEVPDDLA